MLAKPKILATREDFQLVFEPNRLDCYDLYSTKGGSARIKPALARSIKLIKSVTHWFTEDQVRDAKARVQAAKRVAKTYGF